MSVEDTDSVIFAWAKEFSDKIPNKRHIRLVELDTHIDRIGEHISLYRDDATDNTLMCVYAKKGLCWRKVHNFREIMQTDPELTNLWLRNGRYLYTYLYGGKGVKVVNIKYIKND